MRAIGVLLLVLGFAACGTSPSSLCDAKCDCEGCSKSDFDHCVSSYESDAANAENRGCSDYFNDLIACRERTSYCDKKAHWESSCGAEKTRHDNCMK